MKKELKPGDRVRVNFLDGSTAKGNVQEILTNGYLKVFIGKNRVAYPHPMQCRRLRPKAKPERERIERVERDRRWIVFNSRSIGGIGHEHLFETHNEAMAYVAQNYPQFMPIWEYTIVREGEQVISREALAAAWDECKFADRNPNVCGSGMFDLFCKALGFPVSKKGEGA